MNDDFRWLKNFYAAMIFILLGVSIATALLFLNSCNFSVNLIHSGKEGSIDEVDEASPDVKPNLNLTGIP